MYTSQITIGSQTNAIKASRLLRSVKINCEVIKMDKDKAKGCIYGIRVNTDSYKTALNILKEHGLYI